jgi:hypothetical protein
MNTATAPHLATQQHDYPPTTSDLDSDDVTHFFNLDVQPGKLD